MSTQQNKKKEAGVMESLSKVSDILKLQLKVSEESKKTREKVEEMEEKFEKLQKEAYDTCPVCYEDISVKNTCCMPNCSHKMCKGCYYNWLDTQEKNTCPMCREEVFKNNLDIKTKRSVLQNHLDSLESEVSEMYEERRIIRKSMVQTKKEEQDMEDTVKWLYNKYDQLRDEIFDNEQIMDEIREYKRDPEKWREKKERRLKKDIHKGYRIWRSKMKIINKEFNKQQEEEVEDEEVDISELNMFELPPEFAGDETRKTMGTYAVQVFRSRNRVVLEEGEIDEIPNDYYDYGTDCESGYDTDETFPMPELEEITDQELENMALEGTTFEQDELEYDRGALNVPSPLEEGEIPEPINIGRYNIINEEGTIINTFNYVHRSPTGGWQQTDDSYRPRRLTYPENEES